MPFKIVQTEENNKSYLTVVPSSWERDQTLFWPRKLNEQKLIHDEFSVPKTDWKVMPCKMKREYTSLSAANAEVERMEQMSDSENDTAPPISSYRQRSYNEVLTEVNLNEQIVAANIARGKMSNTPSPVQLQITAPSSKTVSESSSFSNINANETIIINVPDASCSSGNEVHYQIVESSEDLLKKIYEEQKHMRSQVAVLQASVDCILQNFLKAPVIEEKHEKNNIIKPVGNKKELEELEEYLKQDGNFFKTIDAMKFICGSSGKSRGVDSCYKLVDYFFTRELLLDCSWTGTSRQNDSSKIPLKYFLNVRKCFLTLVRKSDKDFSEQDCDKFFKTIIKNAKQRLHPKIMSATKHRTKKSTVPEGALEPLQEETERGIIEIERQANQAERREEADQPNNLCRVQEESS